MGGRDKGGVCYDAQVCGTAGANPQPTQFGRFGGGFGGAVDTAGLGALRDSIARADQWRFLQGRTLSLNPRQFSYYGYIFISGLCAG